jgi:hypothetical protein
MRKMMRLAMPLWGAAPVLAALAAGPRAWATDAGGGSTQARCSNLSHGRGEPGHGTRSVHRPSRRSCRGAATFLRGSLQGGCAHERGLVVRAEVQIPNNRRGPRPAVRAIDVNPAQVNGARNRYGLTQIT